MLSVGKRLRYRTPKKVTFNKKVQVLVFKICDKFDCPRMHGEATCDNCFYKDDDDDLLPTIVDNNDEIDARVPELPSG